LTTSGSYSFSVNRDQVIRQAMLNIGKLDESEVPTAQQTSDCAFCLNMLIKQWQGRADFAPGLKVWTRRRGHLFLSGTTGQYSVGPGATGWTESYASTTTASAAAQGATVVTVSSTVGIAATYHIGIELNSGTIQWTPSVRLSERRSISARLFRVLRRRVDDLLLPDRRTATRRR
jgi:hypothetical protein